MITLLVRLPKEVTGSSLEGLVKYIKALEGPPQVYLVSSSPHAWEMTCALHLDGLAAQQIKLIDAKKDVDDLN